MKKININLLQREKKIQALTGQLIYFALFYLRYIVIMTQVIVIGVFFYRFSVDQRVIDLKESVSQKQEILKVAQPLIKEARLVEAKANVIKTLLDKQESLAGDFDYITSVIPQTVVLKQLTITDSTIELQGETLEAPIIRRFYERLIKEQQFKSIVLNSISKKEFIFDFSVSIEI